MIAHILMTIWILQPVTPADIKHYLEPPVLEDHKKINVEEK